MLSPHPVPSGAESRRSGIALIATIVLMLLVVVLVLSFLRILRAKVVVTGAEGDAGSVLNGLAADVLQQIADDMPIRGRVQEPYDYPWCCTSLSDGTPTRRRVSLSYPDMTDVYPAPLSAWAATVGGGVVGGPITTFGDPAQDDDWLASSIPENGKWPHLSNIYGTCLDARDAAGNPTGNLTLVRKHPVTGKRVPPDKAMGTDHVDVPMNDARLADADGDGVGDSLWFYPKNALVGDRRYVAAVYVEDLSAKINLNTATQLPFSAGDPLGRTPADVNLGALSSSVFAAAGAASSSELDAMTAWRNLGSAPGGTTSGFRELYYESRGARVTQNGDTVPGNGTTIPADTNRFGAADQLALSFHGGLRDKELSTISALATQKVESPGRGLPGFLKASGVYADYAAMGFANKADFLQGNPRRWVTAYSGEAANSTGQGRGDGNVISGWWFRANPNMRNDDSFYHMMSDWSMQYANQGPDRWNGQTYATGPALSAGGAADNWTMPDGYRRIMSMNADGTLRDANARWDNFWRAVLPAVRDAKDADSLVTGSWDFYGFEPLPMLTEAYVQREACLWLGGNYNVQTWWPVDAAHPVASSYPKYDTVAQNMNVTTNADGTKNVSCWTNNGTVRVGYVFEIANPYTIPVKLNHVYWDVHQPGVWWTGAQPLTNVLGGWSDKDADNNPVLLPGHKILLWRNGSHGSISGSADPNTDMSAWLNAKASADPTIHLLNSNYDLFDTYSDQRDFMLFQLSCDYTNVNLPDNTVNGQFLGYCTLSLPWGKNIWREKYTPGASPMTDAALAAPATGKQVGIYQACVTGWGVSQGLNCLQCVPGRNGRQVIDHDTGIITSATPADAGDMVVRYNKATNPYSAAMYATLGMSDKSSVCPNPAAGRVDLRNENFWFSNNGLRNNNLPGSPLQASAGRFDSLMDMMRIPIITMRMHDNGNFRPPELAQLSERYNSMSGKTVYASQGLAPWLYYLLDNGTKPLSAICRHSVDASGCYAPYDPAASYVASPAPSKVYYQGYYYQAVSPSTGVTPVPSGNASWVRESQKDCNGWLAGTAYAADDEVFREYFDASAGRPLIGYFRALAPSTGTDPATSPGSWQRVPRHPGVNSSLWMYQPWEATKNYLAYDPDASGSSMNGRVSVDTSPASAPGTQVKYYRAQQVPNSGATNDPASRQVTADPSVSEGLGMPWIREAEGPVAPWSATTAYAPGDEVFVAPNNYYRAITASTGADPLAASNANLNVNNTNSGKPWYEVPHHDYVNARMPTSWLLPNEWDINTPSLSGGYDYTNDGTLKWFDHNGNGSGTDYNTAPFTGNNNGIKEWNGNECDWWAEYVVPGRINVNTMPEFLLAQALPVADPTLRAQLANLIVARRKSPPAVGTRTQVSRGLASPLEILTNTGGAGTAGYGPLTDGAALLAGFTGRPATDVNGDGVIDAKDARLYDVMGAYGFLTQSTSCRSDFYAVHILLQAYRADDFSAGPVESRRRLIIVSRTNITQGGPSSPNVIAQYDY